LFVTTAPAPTPAPFTTAYAPPPAQATTSTAAITIAAMIPPDAAAAKTTAVDVPTPQLIPLNPSKQTQRRVVFVAFFPDPEVTFLHSPLPLQASGQGGGINIAGGIQFGSR